MREPYKELEGRREFYIELLEKRKIKKVKKERQERKEVKEIILDTGVRMALHDNQMFCTTEKSWEIWDIEPLRFVKRWGEKRVLVVIEK